MTLKRLILIVLTIASLIPVVFSLGGSLSQPQVQARLQLYQTNLVLQASEFIPESLQQRSPSDLTAARDALIGSDPYSAAQEQYQEALQVAQQGRSSLQAQLQSLAGSQADDVPALERQTVPIVEGESTQQLQQAMTKLQEFINELRLNIGILQAQQQEQEAAFSTWNEVNLQPDRPAQSQTARALIGLWSEPPQILPESESLFEQTLTGWFQTRALKQLYQIQEQELAQLRSQEQQLAQRAVVKLALIGGVPFVGGVIGVGILIVLLVQLFVQKERSLLAANVNTWETPWNWEVIWQVLIVGFFFISQILLPVLFTVLGFSPTGLSLRFKAVYILVSYLLVAVGGLLVLYLSLKPFFPLPKFWFRFQWMGNWIVWGVGGYLVALPLVVIVSLLNQQIWQGQGGSNPLLFLALQAQDRVALAIFFFTASVAAPLFEEMIFRGFLLPSLTRYLSVWGAIVVSSLVFALAHLSLSEVLPLTVLGIVLAVVYTRSKNLLASILLHSLWNSGTLISLFILGSSG
ncbi:MAG: type II CAAX prenyl endopeptidase Rce1 family protein [Cyanophyceae cyanobacterium]